MDDDEVAETQLQAEAVKADTGVSALHLNSQGDEPPSPGGADRVVHAPGSRLTRTGPVVMRQGTRGFQAASPMRRPAEGRLCEEGPRTGVIDDETVRA
ncbi:hypothetical protein [Streptomyces sp. SP18CS02]|uniref:hypothetical protein n=1 Tax=Streptomyces sp. SP18CS02 TaxID=3002531 RepID=UPI002E780E60|nr:hypothetical protein [Streptomyces sp. SP18CS02]MEE1752701.1 hypothetical protein [Streptomyces sp. SP18CS02]